MRRKEIKLAGAKSLHSPGKLLREIGILRVVREKATRWRRSSSRVPLQLPRHTSRLRKGTGDVAILRTCPELWVGLQGATDSLSLNVSPQGGDCLLPDGHFQPGWWPRGQRVWYVHWHQIALGLAMARTLDQETCSEPWAYHFQTSGLCGVVMW